MKYLLIGLVSLSGCGFKVNADVAPVTVTHRVDVALLEPYIAAYCEQANTTPENIEACVNAEIGKLVTKL